MNFFKPEDFYSKNFVQEYIGSPISGKVIRIDEAVKVANQLLSERGVKVYTHRLKDIDGRPFAWVEKHRDDDTHQALLINIEELPKKECGHNKFETYHENSTTLDSLRGTCLICGIKLKATWSPA